MNLELEAFKLKVIKTFNRLIRIDYDVIITSLPQYLRWCLCNRVVTRFDTKEQMSHDLKQSNLKKESFSNLLFSKSFYGLSSSNSSFDGTKEPYTSLVSKGLYYSKSKCVMNYSLVRGTRHAWPAQSHSRIKILTAEENNYASWVPRIKL